MQKNKKKSNKRGIIIFLSILVVILAIFLLFIFVGLKPASKKSEEVTFIVKPGESKITVINNLKNANLLKNKYAVYFYVFFKNDLNLQAGTYKLNRNMKAKDIINEIAGGKIVDLRKSVSITFVEGKRLKQYATLLSKKLNISEEDFLNKLKDKEFLESLIEKYWFITDDILNKDLYFSLEGYLFPSTYQFFTDATAETVIYRMLDQMELVLNPYKEQITSKNMKVHDVLAMASIIEKEALSAEDRKMVSQVIYKRLNAKMALGMDVTTYYAVQKDLTDYLTKVDLDSNNPYNTRNVSHIGLPVGPICSPSKESIDAVFNPSDTDYLYFYADITTGKVYFAKTYEEFINFKKELGGK